VDVVAAGVLGGFETSEEAGRIPTDAKSISISSLKISR
jgi:hypothetical protein